MQINCYRDNTHGSSSDIATAIDKLDRGIVKKQIVTHCPRLEVPTIITEFNALTDLDLYNSTLLSWPKEAAPTSTSLRSFTNFNWFASPYTSFPEGLLHRNLPNRFTRFGIARSNLTELPDSLGDAWSSLFLDVFSIQFTNLGRMPTTFKQLSMSKLRLISNNISRIDDDALASKQPRVLHLSGNPLQ